MEYPISKKTKSGSATVRSAIKKVFTLPGIDTYQVADSIQLGINTKIILPVIPDLTRALAYPQLTS